MMINKEYVQMIKRAVSDKFGVPVTQMEAKTRLREVVIARQTAMDLMWNIANMPLKAIGAEFGNRDHSTVIHARKAVSNMIDTDRMYRRIQVELMKYCQNEIDEAEKAEAIRLEAIIEANRKRAETESWMEKRFQQTGCVFIAPLVTTEVNFI